MALNKVTKSKSFDWTTISVFVSLVFIGWLMVFATLYNENQPYAFLDFSTPIGAQTVWVCLSLFVFFVALSIDWKFWNVSSIPIYIISLILLILVLIFGKVINGARAWFSFGLFSFQPSEWAKLGTALAVASYLSFSNKIKQDFNYYAICAAIFIIPALLILLQPDLGSAIVFLSFFMTLYRKGMSPILLLFGIASIIVFVISILFGPLFISLLLALAGVIVIIVLFENQKNAFIYSFLIAGVWLFLVLQKEYLLAFLPIIAGYLMYVFKYLQKSKVAQVFYITVFIALASGFAFGSNFMIDKILKPHQQDRINVWLRPEKCDPRGSLYNIIQSKMAISSGGLLGKGFLNGEMTKLNYVPEQSTDFIFTSIGEEQGFIGSLGVIFLFGLLLYRCIVIAERANLEFVKYYAYCVFGIIFIHFVFNIGMTIGLLPVVGIPLPFISKGGSSLLAFTLMIAILVRLDLARIRAN